MRLTASPSSRATERICTLGQFLTAARGVSPAAVGWALGVPVPDNYAGRPLYEAFTPRALAVAQD